jgi:hypothetical protein
LRYGILKKQDVFLRETFFGGQLRKKRKNISSKERKFLCFPLGEPLGKRYLPQINIKRQGNRTKKGKFFKKSKYFGCDYGVKRSQKD